MDYKGLTTCTVVDYRCGCFEKLSPEELDLIKQNEVIVKYKKGETIYKQGTFAANVMVMQKGLAKVFIEGKHDTLILKIIPEGNMLGLTSISDQSAVRKYSAAAYVDSEVRLIDINIFRQLINTNTGFAFEIINLLSANSTQINGRFFCLTHKQTYGKLADILLCLTDNVFKSREFEMMLSRKDLAELSGMSTESVIRMLKKFKQDKIIEMAGKTFRVLNYEKLQEISSLG